MRQPTVSVVIRTLNEGKTLGAVFNALAAQTIIPDEVIVVDSGSTDNTTTIAKEQGATIIDLPSGMFSYGRSLNIGFAASKGQIIVALSGHAIPTTSDWLRNLVSNFHSPSVAAVSSKLVYVPRSKLHNYWYHMPFLVHRKWTRNNLWLFWNTAAAYQRNIWKRFPFNEEVPGCEDRDWAIRVLSNDLSVIYEPKAAVWHAHSESYVKFLKRIFMLSRMMVKMDNDLKLRKKLHHVGATPMLEE